MSQVPVIELKVLRDLSNFFEGQAEGARVSAGETDDATAKAALLAASDILSGLSFALSECADEGHAAPVQTLAAEVNDWLDATAVYEVASPPHELARLLDDGCPHATEAH